MSTLAVRALLVFWLLLFIFFSAEADPARYHQFAQQNLPQEIKPEFISVAALAAELKKGAKPVIVDVRSTEEFKEAHIAGAISAPLENFRDHIKSIPRDRTTILY